jgi:two-component system, OmpR family, phosphate regulon sensor histidine kinase PhoR
VSDRDDRALPLQVLDALHEGVVVVDARRSVVLMNPRAEQLLGRRWAPGAGLADLFPESASQAALEAAIAAGRATSQAFCHKLGEAVLEVGVSPFTGGGMGMGAVILLSDITEAWKAEQERLRFVSMVAHELKSPLSAILNYLNVILTGMFDGDPAKVREMLERCKIRGEALLDLVRDLLYINRRETGPERKDAEDLDLCAVLGEQVAFFTVQTERRSITVKVRCDAPRAMVRADRADLDRIFMNLVSNAIKYNRDGGSIDVRVTDADNGWTVAISDTGIGMSESEREGLFREFYRVKNERTAGIPGTGLGLTTVKRVLSDYGAKIAVASKPGKGSTFTVTFPKAAITPS